MGQEKLTFKERLSYGAGDFAQNGMYGSFLPRFEIETMRYKQQSSGNGF